MLREYIVLRCPGTNSLPISPKHLAGFITHMYSVHYASSIIGSTVSTISFTHKLVGLADPADNYYIKKLGVRRRSVSVDSRRPIDRHVSLKL